MKVKLDEKTIEVSKLPIGKYSELLEVLRLLPDRFSLLANSSNKDIIKMLPDLVINNLPQAIQLIHIGTALPQDEVEALGLNECVDLIIAIIEVNKYTEVWEKIKKALPRLPKKEQTPIGS